MAGPRDSFQPPSDPRPGTGRGGEMSHAVEDRSLNTQLAVALFAGLALFASGLYLWRRPQAPADPMSTEAPSAPASAAAAVASIAVADAGSSSPVLLSDTRVLACHDRGVKRTPPDQCDHLMPLEKALSNAVERSAACVPDSAGGGTIQYVADVSFSRHKLSVILPRAGRSVRDRKVLAACATAVRTAVVRLPLDGVDHQHARYTISITATYKGSARGG
jgi:hypothetical protein